MAREILRFPNDGTIDADGHVLDLSVAEDLQVHILATI